MPVQLVERALERLERDRQLGPLLAQVLVPVDPPADELPVVELLAHEDVGHREQHGRLRAGPGREPPVGHRRGVGQARVDDRDLRASRLCFHDPLGVRIEIVAGLEMRREQQDEARVRVIRRGAIHPMPEGVARARARRAHVRVAVVAVDPPGVEDALEVNELVTRPAEVIHDFLLPTFHERLADPPTDVVERLVPGDALPLTPSAGADPTQRVEDPLRVIHLVERRRALGAVAATASRVRRVALELLDLERRPVDVGEEAAGGLAVEADRRDQRVPALDLSRPGDGVELFPVLPALHGRIAHEATLPRGQLPSHRMKRLGG